MVSMEKTLDSMMKGLEEMLKALLTHSQTNDPKVFVKVTAKAEVVKHMKLAVSWHKNGVASH